MPVLPEWLRMLWVAGLLVAVAVHARHACLVGGPGRWWHAGHTTMAVGMTLMYLTDRMLHPALYQAALVLFALLTTAAITAVLTRREGLLDALRMGVTLDLMAMVYMLLPTQDRNPALTGVILAYLGFQVMIYTLGRGRRSPSHTLAIPGAQELGTVTTLATESTMPLKAPHAAVVDLAGRGVFELYQHHRRQLYACSTPSVRASLAVVAASMGYMLAVM